MFNFPWTNFHELNLDWILDVVKEAKAVFDNGREDIDYAVSTANEAKEIARQAAESTIPDNSVSTAKIQDYAVNANKLSNYSVTESKLQNAAVTTAKLADSAVTTPKIADGAVTNAKLDTVSITKGGTGSNNINDAASALSVESRYKIFNGAGISTTDTRRISFTNAVDGLLLISGSTSARLGLYIVHGTATTVLVETVKAASACTITTGNGYFDITSTSGSIYATLLTHYSLSRLSESAAT